ncbi:hypothetical protein ACW95P_03090 [Candidatus Mycoplasma pogonae]
MKSNKRILLSLIATPFVPLALIACGDISNVEQKQIKLEIKQEIDKNNTNLSYFRFIVTNLPNSSKVGLNISSTDDMFSFSKNFNISETSFQETVEIPKNIAEIRLIIKVDDIEVKNELVFIEHKPEAKIPENKEPKPNDPIKPKPVEPNPRPEIPKVKPEIASLFTDFSIQINSQLYPSQFLENESTLILNKNFFNIKVNPAIQNPVIELKALSFSDYNGKLKLQVKISSGTKTDIKTFEFDDNLKLNISTPEIEMKISNLNLKNKNIDDYFNFLNDSNKTSDEKLNKLKELGSIAIIDKSPLIRPKILIKKAQKINDILYVWYSYEGKMKKLIEGNSKISEEFYSLFSDNQFEINWESQFQEIFSKIVVKSNFSKGTVFPSWFKYIFEYPFHEQEKLFDTSEEKNLHYHGKRFTLLGTGFSDISFIFNKDYYNQDFISQFIDGFFDIPPEIDFQKKYVIAVKSIDAVDDKAGTIDVTLTFLKKVEDSNGHYESGSEIYQKSYKITGLNKWNDAEFNNFHVIFWLDANNDRSNSYIHSLLNSRENKSQINAKWDTNEDYDFNTSIINAKKYGDIFNFLYKGYSLSFSRPDLYPFPIYWWNNFYENFKLTRLYIHNKKLRANVTYKIKISGFEEKTFTKSFEVPIYKNGDDENYKFKI